MGLKAIRSAIWRVAALSAERPGPAGLMILAFSGCGRNYAGSRPASIKIRVTARPGGNREEATMRLTWRDGSATLLVAAAAAVYALWATGTAMATTSATVIAAVLFGLGWAACLTDQREMEIVYGADRQHPRPPLGYVVLTSAIGVMTLGAGIAALVTATDTTLVILLAGLIALWMLATTRHILATHADRGGNAPARHLAGGVRA
jgi:hypothetical protein